MDSQNAAASNVWVAALRMALMFCNTWRHHNETGISRSQFDVGACPGLVFCAVVVRANQLVHYDWAAPSAGLRAARLPRRRLPLDSRLLGLGGWRLLLGARHLDARTGTRFSLDPQLLGLA